MQVADDIRTEGCCGQNFRRASSVRVSLQTIPVQPKPHSYEISPYDRPIHIWILDGAALSRASSSRNAWPCYKVVPLTAADHRAYSVLKQAANGKVKYACYYTNRVEQHCALNLLPRERLPVPKWSPGPLVVSIHITWKGGGCHAYSSVQCVAGIYQQCMLQ